MSEPGRAIDGNIAESNCSDTRRIIDLAEQLTATIASVRAKHSHVCLGTALTSDQLCRPPLLDKGQGHDAAISNSGSRSIDNGEISTIQALQNRLDAKDDEIRTQNAELIDRDAQLRSLKAELKLRTDRYAMLSAAHMAALARLEACKDGMARLEWYQQKYGQRKRRKQSSYSDGNTPHLSSSDGAVDNPAGPPTPRFSDNIVADEDLIPSSPVEFVSERPVHHPKRAKRRAEEDAVSNTQRPIKEELSPERLLPLNRLLTTLTQGLDLDSIDAAKQHATPRKSRQSSARLTPNPGDGQRPVTASHEAKPPAAHIGLRNDGTRSFGAVDLDPVTFGAEYETLSSATRRETGQGSSTRSPQLEDAGPERAQNNILLDSPNNAVNPGATKGQPVLLLSQESNEADARRSAPAPNVLQERDPNITTTPVPRASSTPKNLGKRKRDVHGSSKIGLLAEDGDTRATSAAKTKKSGRLSSLLNQNPTDGTQVSSPKPRVVTPRNANTKTAKRGKKLRYSAPEDLGLADFKANPGRLRDLEAIENGHRSMPVWLTGRSAEEIVEQVNQRFLVGTSEGPSSSPPGYWRADMVSTQELEAMKKSGEKAVRDEVAKRRLEAIRGDGLWLFRDE